MNKPKTLRLALAVAVAAAVAVPLVAQVKNAQKQTAQQAAAAAPQQAAEPLPPATMPAVDPDKVIASEGDVTCTGADFNVAAATLPPQYQPLLAQPAMRKRLADSILQYKLLAVEAKRRGLDQKPEIKRQLAMQEDQVLAQALAKQIEGGADETANREYFDSHKSNFDNVKARHILIRTPGSPVPSDQGKKELTDAEAKAKADQIKQRLDKGEDFSKIAKVESDDKGSGVQGGDLGTFAPWKMDATFSKAALGLKPNQVSEPVKTQFGYHIIQLLEDKPRTYDEAKGEIGEARMQALVSELKSQKTNYDPAFFGSSSASGSSPTTQPTPASSVAPAQPPAAKRGV